MSRIEVLDKKTANAIKAGEVIERPVSVVKELFDNAVDSGASRITVEFKNGGISLIRVSDNGIGMDREDAEKAFLIHATSKIRTIDDLSSLSSMGFRGEALPSIAACSIVELVTKQADSSIGTKITYDDGELKGVEECSADNGTVVTVKDLFYNTPARYKFLKKDSTEGMYICTLVEKLAIVNPHITVKLIKDGTMILSTPGNGSMLDTIYCIYGKQIANQLVPVDYTYEDIRVSGFTAKPDLTRSNRSLQLFYVNERTVKCLTAQAAVEEAYRNSVMKGKFPVCFLNIYVEPSNVDCNIHPQKIEVKISNDSSLFRAVYHGVKNALESLRPKQEEIKDEIFEYIDEKPETKSLIPNESTYDRHSTAGEGFRDLEKVSKPSQVEIRAANNILNILSGIDSVEEVKEEPVEKEPEFIEPVLSTSDDFNKKRNSDIEILLNSKIVGALFATFIVFQSNDCVYLLDQHAAHERVLYEEFLAKALDKEGTKDFIETLLVPDIVSLSSADYVFALDHKDEFKKYGFDIEAMGDREIAIRTIPSVKNMVIKPSVMFNDLLDDLKKDLPVGDNAWYLKIATAACKAAIKGRDIISADEIKALLTSMLTLDDPYHCPHGRPTFIKLTETDIDKMFKRIV
ncbi:MAG: DNA mismatch repair endonuclease MutL [Clostridiales bacterium]|nr:DNA mismatch repair endonuclease MutL [Clostridiales bacterium]